MAHRGKLQRLAEAECDSAGRVSLRRARGGRIPLRTFRQVREELARVYRDARQGRIESQDATRLAFILDQLRKAIEADELLSRVEALEAGSAPRMIADEAPSGSFRFITGQEADEQPAPAPEEA